jgi:hypothetical protein
VEVLIHMYKEVVVVRIVWDRCIRGGSNGDVIGDV